MASLTCRLTEALARGDDHEAARAVVVGRLMTCPEEAIYKVRASSRRTIFVRLREQKYLTAMLADLGAVGECTGLSEQDHAAKAGSRCLNYRGRRDCWLKKCTRVKRPS